MSLIDFPLLTIHLCKHIFLYFFRKKCQYIFFQTAKDKGGDHFLNPVQGIFILLLNDRKFQLLPKSGITE